MSRSAFSRSPCVTSCIRSQVRSFVRFPTVSFDFFPDLTLVFDLDFDTAAGGCCCTSGCCCAIADLLLVATGSFPVLAAVLDLVVVSGVGEDGAGTAGVDAGCVFFPVLTGEEVVDRSELDCELDDSSEYTSSNLFFCFFFPNDR